LEAHIVDLYTRYRIHNSNQTRILYRLRCWLAHLDIHQIRTEEGVWALKQFPGRKEKFSAYKVTSRRSVTPSLFALLLVAIICFLWALQLKRLLSPRMPPRFDYFLDKLSWYALGYAALIVGIALLMPYR
jgi:hypothetical protein